MPWPRRNAVSTLIATSFLIIKQRKIKIKVLKVLNDTGYTVEGDDGDMLMLRPINKRIIAKM